LPQSQTNVRARFMRLRPDLRWRFAADPAETAVDRCEFKPAPGQSKSRQGRGRRREPGPGPAPRL